MKATLYLTYMYTNRMYKCNKRVVLLQRQSVKDHSEPDSSSGKTFWGSMFIIWIFLQKAWENSG